VTIEEQQAALLAKAEQDNFKDISRQLSKNSRFSWPLPVRRFLAKRDLDPDADYQGHDDEQEQEQAIGFGFVKEGLRK
jgi:hypothetical protein